jgi:5-methylcytosine-specific restriction protein A
MKKEIRKAFIKYDAGVRPKKYGKPSHWYVLSEKNAIYPAKIIWAIANDISSTTEFHSRYAREQFEKNGFYLFDNRMQKDDNFHLEIEKATKDTSENRRNRLSKSDKQPKIIYELVQKFKRNPDVVAEVLFRAKGVCQKCGNNAPFNKKKDGHPYLEVHHKLPLAQGGDDSLENAIAMCPNCHREAHFGEQLI